MDSVQFNYFASSIIGTLTAFSLYKVFKAQSEVNSSKKLINKIKSFPIKSVDDHFIAGQNVIIKGNVKRNQKDHRNDKIIKQANLKKNVEDYVIYIKYKEAIYSNQNFTDKEQYYVKLNQILGRADIACNPSFLLAGQNKSVTITNFDQSNYQSILDITKWDNLKRRLTFSEKLQSLMLSYFRAIGTLVITDRGRPGFLRGIDVGTREVETGLKVGASIMALGTIGINSDGQIFLQPNLLFKDRLSIVATLNDGLKSNQDSRNLWFVILILGGIYIGRRAYKYQKKHDVIAKIKRWWRGQSSVQPAKV